MLSRLLVLLALAAAAAAAEKPNILLILTDDLGFGDVQCNNPQRGRIPTPHLDKLAAAGMRFTDAHSSSGVCSPSRYTLLTGRYHWRSRLQAGIVGYLERPLIAENRLTLPALLRQNGYSTACIGKWHLGWDWPIPDGQRPLFAPGKGTVAVTDGHRNAWRQVFSQPIAGGPVTRGFDSYFGTDVPNWPPFCFMENDRTRGIPTEFLPAKLLGNNQASVPGPALADWKLEGILPALADRACEFISTAAKAEKPFFLYLPLTSPHTPLAVNEAWRGKSGLDNEFADFVMETDAAVGRVIEALDKTGAGARTLVIFSSDNGCAPYAGVKQLESRGHFPSGPWRGYKADAWEGGHRVPFFVRWPGIVKAGAVCDRLVHHADVMATCAEVLGAALPATAAEDSFSLLPLLKSGTQPVRQHAISHASSGLASLRKDSWKIIFGRGGGGFNAAAQRRAAPDQPPGQLYNLAEDPGETANLWKEKPELVAELTQRMEKLVSDGRSTPGAPQKNDVPVRWSRAIQTPD